MWDVSIVPRGVYTAIYQEFEENEYSLEILLSKYAWLGKDTAAALYRHFQAKIYLKNEKKLLAIPGKIKELYRNIIEEVNRSSDEMVLFHRAIEERVSPFRLALHVVQIYVDAGSALTSLEDKRTLVKAIMKEDLQKASYIANSSPALLKNIAVCISRDKTLLSLSVQATSKEKGLCGENALIDMLECKGIPYFTDLMLQAAGEVKRPDFLLQIPVVVGSIVVNWFESKFMFGNKASFLEIKRNQLEPYKNRFGNGVIIFWLGCVEGLMAPEGVLIFVRFPTDIRPYVAEHEDRSF